MSRPHRPRPFEEAASGRVIGLVVALAVNLPLFFLQVDAWAMQPVEAGPPAGAPLLVEFSRVRTGPDTHESVPVPATDPAAAAEDAPPGTGESAPDLGRARHADPEPAAVPAVPDPGAAAPPEPEPEPPAPDEPEQPDEPADLPAADPEPAGDPEPVEIELSSDRRRALELLAEREADLSRGRWPLRVWRAVDDQVFLPRDYELMGVNDHVVLLLDVDATGALTDLRFERRSDHLQLNYCARLIVERARIPAPPGDWTGSAVPPLRITIRFE